MPKENSPNKPIDADEKEYLCYCNRVTVEDVENLIKSGQKRMFKIQKETGATEGCGSCKDDLYDLVMKYKIK